MPTHSPTGFSYRADIDGLRAIAVLAVVLFHLGFAPLEGGFLGVDIFFVISGYLITSIIAPKIISGEFSFKTFYLKRIRRLTPPALVIVALTFLASAFILDPTDLLAMAKSAIASVFSVSNILFFTEAGYWDAQSELKPLLHTWSLGVEEQFYIFWPLLVFLLWKCIPQRKFAIAFAVITLIGIGVSEWMLRLNPSAAFFLLPARVFEFSIGACFAFIGKTEVWARIGNLAIRSILGWASLLIILATIWLYKQDTPFPGLNGVLPCLATALLLLCGTGIKAVPVLGALLSNPLMSWIGRLSYSLYLIHWPVLALMRYKVGLELELHHQLMAVALMAALTLLLYYGVERRISARAGQSVKSPEAAAPKPARHGRFAIGSGLAALALTAVFSHAALNSGWTWRFPALSFTPEQVKLEKKRRFYDYNKSCMVLNFPNGKHCKPDAKTNILVIGNSHEPDGFNFFKAGYGHKSDIQLIHFGQDNGCNFKKENRKYTSKNSRKRCQERVDQVVNPKFTDEIDMIIYSSNRPFASKRFFTLSVVKDIKAQNSQVKLITMGGYINNEAECFRYINETGYTSACVQSENVSSTPESNHNGTLYQAFMDITDYYLDKAELLCGNVQPESCESETPDRIPFTYDQHHLTLEFAQYAGRKFAAQNPDFFEKLALQGKP